jgi:hypothetical protein
LGLVAYTARDVTTLTIGANDGSRTVFTGTDRSFLDEVKTFLADKINAGDQRGATFIISQSRREVREVGISAGPFTVGSTVAAAPNSAHVRADTPEPHSARVDYSSVLPELEQWQRNAAASPGWEVAAKQLSELKVMLKTGTPTKEDRSKARALVSNLGTNFQAYPAVLQMFQTVSRLAGQ